LKKKFLKKNLFPKPLNMGPRIWGREDLLVLISKKFTLKKIKIKQNKKGGLQYHHKKNECGYIIKGKLKIKFDLGNGILKSKILKKGDVFYFPQGLVHQEIALTDCEIIEASTPHFNDRVRVEKKYGIKSKKGLPTTKKKDVKYL
tara:strand:- start:1745 stop:2179 length:435 start_codon:yes stop_codon:yes gene_type:complete